MHITFRGILPVAVVLLAACGGDDGAVEPDPDPTPDPAAVAVSHVTLTPWPDPPDSLAPPDTGWPDVGSGVTWGAVLHNPGGETGDVVVRWRVDGTVVGVDTVVVPPGRHVAALPRAWSDEPEWITVALSGPDVDEAADSIRVPTRGLSVGLHLEPSVWDWIESRFDGGVAAWASAEVDRWNHVLADAVTDRLRLHTLARADAYPDTVWTDLVWWFRNGADARFAQTGSSLDVLSNQSIVLHELLHQRGLADLYAYEVWVGNHLSRMDILDPDGTPALGTDRLPAPAGAAGRIWTWEGTSQWLMGSNLSSVPLVADVTAWGMDRVAGLRTPRWSDSFGNRVNALTWRNDYLLVMPDRVSVVVRDLAGTPLAGAMVEVFPDRGTTAYDDQYDAHPAWTGTADETGTVTFPGEVIRPTPDVGAGSVAATAIVRVRVGDTWDYVFLPGVDVSTAVARGETDEVTVTLRANPR